MATDEIKTGADMARFRHRNFYFDISFFLILFILMSISGVWQVQAQGTDDSGGVVISPPNEGQSAVVSTKFNIRNVNPTDSEPFVQMGGSVAQTFKDNKALVQRAAFAFGIEHGDIAFSGLIGNVSEFTRAKWAQNTVDNNDVALRCLTDDGQWTAVQVKKSGDKPIITITPTGNNDYLYTITADIEQHGICAVFFSSEVIEDANVSELQVNEDARQSLRALGIRSR